ncbi:MAG: hypothetical protein J5896_02400 [Alphaproteobacteria bacterium]|nr:hypothetical protein [Alphaproteobacteria bacterium]
METIVTFSENLMMTLWISLFVAGLACLIMQCGKGHQKARSLLAAIFAGITAAVMFTLWANWLSWPLWIGSILLTGVIAISLRWSAKEKKEAEL